MKVFILVLVLLSVVLSAPTGTPVPAPVTTGTPVPAAATATPVPAAATATPVPVPATTATPVPVAATATPVPVAATATPVPAAATATPVPVAATATPVPVAATGTPVPVAATATPVPVGATATPVPVATSTPVAQPVTFANSTCNGPAIYSYNASVASGPMITQNFGNVSHTDDDDDSTYTWSFYQFFEMNSTTDSFNAKNSSSMGYSLFWSAATETSTFLPNNNNNMAMFEQQCSGGSNSSHLVQTLDLSYSFYNVNSSLVLAFTLVSSDDGDKHYAYKAENFVQVGNGYMEIANNTNNITLEWSDDDDFDYVYLTFPQNAFDCTNDPCVLKDALTVNVGLEVKYDNKLVPDSKSTVGGGFPLYILVLIILAVILICVATIGAGIGGYMMYQKKRQDYEAI